MEKSFKERLNIPLIEDDSTIDIDGLSARMEELSRQVIVYHEDIMSHITARSDLLGIPPIAGLENKSVEELLQVKDELDDEFRRRFRLKPEKQSVSGIDSQAAKNFLSGR